MGRDQLDGRLVTKCDACGAPIEGNDFAGVPGLTEFLGLGICPSCREAGEADVVDVLLGSGLLTEEGKRAVQDWQALQAPEPIRDLLLLLRGGREAHSRFLVGRQN